MPEREAGKRFLRSIKSVGGLTNAISRAETEGTATDPVVYKLDEKLTIPTSADFHIPKQMLIRQEHGAYFDFENGNGRLTFHGKGLDRPTDRPIFMNAPVNAFSDTSMGAGEANAKGVKFDDDAGNAPLPERISTKLFGFTDAAKNASVSEKINRCDKAFIGKKVTVEVHEGVIDDNCLPEENHSFEWKRGTYQNTFNKPTIDTQGHSTASKRAYVRAPFAHVSGVKHIAEDGVKVYASPTNGKAMLFEPRLIHEAYSQPAEVSGFEIINQGSINSTGSDTVILSGNNLGFKANNNRFIDFETYYCITMMGGQNISKDYYPEDCEANGNYVYNCFSQALNPLRGRRHHFEHNILKYKWAAGVTYSGIAFDAEGNAVSDLLQHIYFRFNEIYYDFSLNPTRTPVPFVIQGAGRYTEEIFIEFNAAFAQNLITGGIKHFIEAWGVNGLHSKKNFFTGSCFGAYNFRDCDRLTVEDTINDAASFGDFKSCTNSKINLTKATNVVNPSLTESNNHFLFVANGTSLATFYLVSFESFRIQEHFNDKAFNLNNIDFTMSGVTMSDDNVNLHREATSSEDFGSKTAFTFAPTDISGNTVNKAHTLRHLEPVLLSGAVTALTLNGKALDLAWIIRHDANSFSFAETLAAAAAGTVAPITGTGTGTQTLTRFQLSVHAIAAASFSGETITFDEAHNLVDGALVFFHEVTGTALGGVTNNQVYHFKSTGAATGKLATTAANLAAGTFVTFSGTPTGYKAIAPVAETRFNNNTFIAESATTVNLSTYSESVRKQIVETKTLTRTSVQLESLWNITLASSPPTLIHAIDCGRVAGGTVGIWEQDTYSSGGNTFNWGVGSPDLGSYGAEVTADVLNTIRWQTAGSFTYTIPGATANSLVVVDLYFMVSGDSAGQAFSVKINGETLLSSYDVFSSVGNNKADRKRFIVSADSAGKVELVFTNPTTRACISGIKVSQIA